MFCLQKSPEPIIVSVPWWNLIDITVFITEFTQISALGTYREVNCTLTISKKREHRIILYVGKGPGGGGVLPYKRLMGMCRWMESHFHDRIDYNGVVFSTELHVLEWGLTYLIFLG